MTNNKPTQLVDFSNPNADKITSSSTKTMTNNKQQTKMNKEFIPYELALEIKQLGFTEPCLASYYHAGRRLDICEYINHGEYTVLAPTYSQAFRWFREKYDIDIYIDIRFLKHDDGISLKKYKVLIPFPNELFIDVGLFTTHEEAELECLKKLIELVKPHEGGNK